MAEVTRDEILKAARTILASGESLSLNRIREMTGHGSYSTIRKVLTDNRLTTRRISKNSYLENRAGASGDTETARVLYETNITISRVQGHIEELEKTLAHLEDPARIGEYIFLYELCQIIIRHLPERSDLPEFLSGLRPERVFSREVAGLTESTVNHMKTLVIRHLISETERIRNSPRVHEFAGGIESLNAIIRMLQDLTERKQSYAQAYHY
ncbi:DNA-binding protein [Succinimonas amylolytica]|uniref:DNA-binding protein n=1 Tax=Succinimonas amylolytica TaxID=83769 RepID=UPI0003774C36|nr:DNA-binding protein [Succinimonas amylolytica]